MTQEKIISEIAKDVGIEVPRLRDWCNRGFVVAEKKGNKRYIPITEIDKIRKIKEFFNRGEELGVQRTFEDLRTYLDGQKAIIDQTEQARLIQQQHLTDLVSNSVLKVVENELAPTLQAIADGFEKLRDENQEQKEKINELTEQVEKLQKMLQEKKKWYQFWRK